MDLNNIRYALSIISLLALVIAAVCYFSEQKTLFLVLLIGSVVCKAGELIIRFKNRKK